MIGLILTIFSIGFIYMTICVIASYNRLHKKWRKFEKTPYVRYAVYDAGDLHLKYSQIDNLLEYFYDGGEAEMIVSGNIGVIKPTQMNCDAFHLNYHTRGNMVAPVTKQYKVRFSFIDYLKYCNKITKIEQMRKHEEAVREKNKNNETVELIAILNQGKAKMKG